MPINQLSTITIPEPRTISIQVWDKSNVTLIDSAIKKSNLGINPQIDGQILRIHIPQLTEERRVELAKTLKSLGEKGKVSIRNIRRESNDKIKSLLKEKSISEDESKDFEKEIQKKTDQNVHILLAQVELNLQRAVNRQPWCPREGLVELDEPRTGNTATRSEHDYTENRQSATTKQSRATNKRTRTKTKTPQCFYENGKWTNMST